MTAEAPAPRRIEWVPNPRQENVLQLIHDQAPEEYGFYGYGGAAGGAKTNLLAWLAINISLTWPGARTLVGRRVFKDLKTTTLEEFDKVCPRELVAKSYDTAPVYRDIRLPSWPAGVVSRVYFRGINDAKNSIGSEEYGWALVEEGAECDKADLLYLFSRLRHKPETKRGMVVAFNPWPSYVTDVFMNGTQNPPGFDDADFDGVLKTRFIPALIRDNPHLPANYESMLRLAYADDPYSFSVLLEGKAGVIPNAIFPMLHDPVVATELRVERGDKRWEDVRFVRVGIGVDWGTSLSHQSAIVCMAMAKDGNVWVLDAWMSPFGSSDELHDVATDFKTRYKVMFARYDRSQGSLEDGLKAGGVREGRKVPGAGIADVQGGIRDVEGRIRVMRGALAGRRVFFCWWKEGVREYWNQLAGYHRDDDDEVVEEKDDLVDAGLYVHYELERPRTDFPEGQLGTTASPYGGKIPRTQRIRGSGTGKTLVPRYSPPVKKGPKAKRYGGGV